MKIIFFIFIAVLALLPGCGTPPDVALQDTLVEQADTLPPLPAPTYEYGFCIDSFAVHRGEIEENWTLSHLLLPHHIGQLEVNKAAQLAKDSCVELKYVSRGKPYVMLCSRDTMEKAQYCIYDKNAYEYVVFDFTDSVNVYKVKRPISYEEKTINGLIVQGSNLSNEVQNATENINITAELVTAIANTYAWSIDFFRLHADDQFKVIYEEKLVEGKSVGMGQVKAMYFQHKGKEFYAFNYPKMGEYAFYDEKGKSNKTLFLKAPLKYTRMSSPYSKRRFHPVQKRWKSHLGTDYAAPTGTPIWSTANGTVIAARYSKYNGYFVKVKHNDTYTTQYLHMSKIAKGMKKGRYVSQGEVIGYVGSTGLATGPHVCYRFWKNGEQVDHRKEVHEATEPIEEALLPAYLEFMAPLKKQLDTIGFEATENPEI